MMKRWTVTNAVASRDQSFTVRDTDIRIDKYKADKQSLQVKSSNSYDHASTP